MKKIHKIMMLLLLAVPAQQQYATMLESIKETINIPNRMSQAIEDVFTVALEKSPDPMRVEGQDVPKKDVITVMKSICSPQVLLAMISATYGSNWHEGENFAIMSYSALDTYNELTATKKVSACSTEDFVPKELVDIMPKSRSILLGNLGSLALGYKTDMCQFQLIARLIARASSGYDIYQGVCTKKKKMIDETLADAGDQLDAMKKDIASLMKRSAARRTLCLTGIELLVGSLLKYPLDILVRASKVRTDANLMKAYMYCKLMNYAATPLLGSLYFALEDNYLNKQINHCKQIYDYRREKAEREARERLRLSNGEATDLPASGSEFNREETATSNQSVSRSDLIIHENQRRHATAMAMYQAQSAWNLNGLSQDTQTVMSETQRAASIIDGAAPFINAISSLL